MQISANRAARRRSQAENRKWPSHLVQVPPECWPRQSPQSVFQVWRSREFLVQVAEEAGHIRLSVCRLTMGAAGQFYDGITWDELQRLKAECGRGDQAAVEIYPPDQHVVNVANMRHLWLVEPPPFMWTAEGERNG